MTTFEKLSYYEDWYSLEVETLKEYQTHAATAYLENFRRALKTMAENDAPGATFKILGPITWKQSPEIEVKYREIY